MIIQGRETSEEEIRRIVLPPPLRSLGKRKKYFPEVPHSTDPVVGSLKEILPLRVEIVSPGGNLSPLFRCFLTKYHYLGYRGTVGKNMTCLVYDNRNRPLACMSFGAAAWKTRPRDSFIGWSPSARESNLEFIANNSRFLILPWVKVPRLASHLLGIFSRGIRGDWVEKYKHPVFLLETFVEKGRFKRTCYKAAGWRCLGDTTGSTRNRENNAPKAPVKEVNVYPPHRHFKELLLGGDSL
ncbi:MAG: DUF4338 domain-containing protein [Proteobacteria bacterium]|nr:DUF4338 domain-containing protein [Pseudomonadota bacterium]